ncbi:hypothetical protein ANN_10250 [Periplaneta americana]|uniref:RNase H type-1 domain-containing protein n=1 Tax=Periplaneta americana TaxID=6978 RepID=A0ABQ8TQ36_PERAM|nr:hypothetical protein ANN_10250 [Periplaneta americana]
MVDRRVNDSAEENKCNEKAISENQIQPRVKRRTKVSISGSQKEYERTMTKEKINSWKRYCSLTPSSNPWNEVYRIASGKTRKPIPLTTLKKPGGSLTSSLKETLQLMIDYFVPEDEEAADNNCHKQVRETNRIPLKTQDDVDFSQQEIRRIIEKMDPNKSPGDDGITSKVLLQVAKILPRYVTAIYNNCLRQAYFPEQWKKARLLPIIKPGKDASIEVTKFRPISLLNTSGKVLEKLLIDRIMHHIQTKNLMNGNQFGFTPQRSTVDAAVALKDCVEESLRQNQYLVLVSLDIQGAFDSAWWPSIMQALRKFHCPRNLYKLTDNYFSQRAAILAANNIKLEKKIEEIVNLYFAKTRHKYDGLNLDYIIQHKNWTHPAELIDIKETEQNTEYTYEIYTDGSKSERGVGAGVAIFHSNELIQQLRFRLDNKCSNNQAEQLAIMKALDNIKRLRTIGERPLDERRIAIYTDSKITLDSLRNGSNHNNLIEDIRTNLRLVENDRWLVDFGWVKAHVGNYGNELADRLAKQAGSDVDLQICYDKVPMSEVRNQLAVISKGKWESEWSTTSKGCALDCSKRIVGSMISATDFPIDGDDVNPPYAILINQTMNFFVNFQTFVSESSSKKERMMLCRFILKISP